MRNLYLLLILLIFASCNEDPLPKPKAYLSLNYPTTIYSTRVEMAPYSFEISNQMAVKEQPNYWLQLNYPKLKASINITYRPIQNNLKELLIESEKLVYKHVVKAEEINPKNFENFDKQVFGSMHEISGNAASQIQFHLTDSTHHFIKGTLSFYAKPNYDSILPAVDYIKKDIMRLIETLEWKYTPKN